MKIKRSLCIILTSPVWLFGGFILMCVAIPLLMAAYVVTVIEYGFTGDWDSPL